MNKENQIRFLFTALKGRKITEVFDGPMVSSASESLAKSRYTSLSADDESLGTPGIGQKAAAEKISNI